MNSSQDLPFFVSIPHSGEKVPAEVTWLQGLPETTLMRDVDRYVDRLYQPAIKELGLTAISTDWSRYVVDLNRQTDEYDATAVEGAPHKAGTHPKGLHWSVTTFNETLISKPMSMDLHQSLVKHYYQPFHDAVKKMRSELKQKFGVVYHLDLHSMPSKGTAFHPDPGEERAQVVISDQHGQSAEAEFKDLVMESFQRAGFQVAYNWPYVGGGITKTYGQPQEKFHTVQIELNRAQYMDEESKQLNSNTLSDMQSQLKQALALVQSGLRERLHGSQTK